ncbi:MAG TPA: MqnA/MqnD/SBP family protein, partial [Phycisphaerales bacterium]|nr:MqnA/MqnD/SBP family protein [Phycisphaerales bacterium]
MDRVRIGCVKYLNTLPLIEGLEKDREIELVSAVPAKLGAMLSAGEVDVALASVVDFATSAVPLAMLAVGGIGCDGPTLTVRLFSQVPLESVR